MAFDRSLCTLATCSVEQYGWYHYVPNLGANAFYLAVFAIFAVIQLYLAIRYKVWGTFAGGLVLGCVVEAIGYAGRVMQARGDGIFKKKYFVIQLVCLTIAPALISAPIYLSLGRVVKAYGRQFSLMAPRTYAIIFICSDVVSLVLQAMGGGMAAVGKTQKKVDRGVYILVAGLAYQVLSLGVFMGLATHLWTRIRKGTESANPRFRELRASRQFRSFIWALSIATITITIRCIYRVVELSGGFKSEAANDEPSLMVLDGPMIMAALLALTICHPGPLFFGDWKRLGDDSGYPEIASDVEQIKTEVERKKWKPPRAQQDAEPPEAREIRSLKAQLQQLQGQLAQYQDQEYATATQAVDFGDVNNTSGSMKLPALQQTMHMIGIYLNTFNSMMPLFDPDSLLQLVGETYATQPRERDPVAWAAINVVLALARQQMPDDGDADAQFGTISDYVNKAQSVVWAVTLGETRLLNIQTLIGMAMLLQAGSDMTPASVIISATMRLIHKMGLHNRISTKNLSPVEQRQHVRVFWLAYIVDKDLSLRAQQPSVQVDDDIDLDLPMQLSGIDEGDAQAGIVTTVDGNTKMNYLLSRIQLASIQGDVYDHLYSTRASKRTPEERRVSRERIVQSLNQWKTTVPAEFNGANVVATTSNNPSTATFLCILHTRSLLCMTLITRAHAWDEQWVVGIRDHGRGTSLLELPIEWKTMVEDARNYMILYEQLYQRFAACTYISAMVMLMANNLNNSQQAEFQQDIMHVDKALVWFQDFFKDKSTTMSDMLGDICTEAVETMKQKRAEDIVTNVGDNWLAGFLDDRATMR
ncbi:uncharacterized protein FIESC28_09935 [Fusarium coffeatum]|uniref:Xylanolytic transcriptional activator regulatory domain-containing protein n=1 Tax=Fusarium coffeatum TaxID=231269 RepID=A0A366QWN5_9HYPO|nr:uncharacterized protein FIESC28_09935 [Fusarium coffeatum]RBR09327.1 hypothetical protein FIESC28_09935 [Fusarium coffeatum]